jgi:very-short-patch-repair endonuclease
MDKKYYTARMLRKNSTIQERRLWNLLKNRQFHNLKFKRQVPLGNYIVDFLCSEIKLVIEIDGGQHNEPKNIEYDHKRTVFLESIGYKVLRFWNIDIYENINGVLEEIEKHISEDI